MVFPGSCVLMTDIGVVSSLFALQIVPNANLCTRVFARNQEAGLLEVELWIGLKLAFTFLIQIL